MAEEEERTPPAVVRWLAARDGLQLIGLFLGTIITISTVVGGVMSIGMRFAEGSFLTLAAAGEREKVLTEKIETRIANGEALAAQRESALAQRLEALRQAQEESNTRMQASVDRIYNLLLQGRR